MKKFLLILSIIFGLSTANAMLKIDTSRLPNGHPTPDSPSKIKISLSETLVGDKAVRLDYTISGKQRVVYYLESALSELGYSLPQFEEKVLNALQAGDAQTLLITAHGGSNATGFSSYIVDFMTVDTEASTPKNN